LAFEEVAAELGVNWHTMMRWRKRKRPKKRALRRVKVVKSSRRTENKASGKSVTVRFPGGATVEGLDIAQVAELMRSLS